MVDYLISQVHHTGLKHEETSTTRSMEITRVSDSRRTSYYIIQHRMSNLRLDVQMGNKNPGARVVPWLAKNWSDQLWYDDHATGTIRSRRTRYCIEQDDNAIVMKPYCQGNVNQAWRRDGPFIRHGLMPDQIICIDGNSTVPGGKLVVEMLDPIHHRHQEFDFIHIPGLDQPYERRHFYIVNEASDKVLDIKGERAGTGASIIVWPKKSASSASSKNQLWYFDSRGVIRSTLNDFVIEAQYGNPAQMELHTKKPSQEWTFMESGVFSKTGECLEIPERDQSSGALVYSSKFYNTPNQRWRLEFV